MRQESTTERGITTQTNFVFCFVLVAYNLTMIIRSLWRSMPATMSRLAVHKNVMRCIALKLRVRGPPSFYAISNEEVSFI